MQIKIDYSSLNILSFYKYLMFLKILIK